MQMTAHTNVVQFYGHGQRAGEYRSFSNFFDQSGAPFLFEVPDQFFRGATEKLSREDRCVMCSYSEKAIMLCKAALMGDRKSYLAIAALDGKSRPDEAKRMGRNVQGWDDKLWHQNVCLVAFEVVHQKFSKSKELQSVLLGTGDAVIAEATSNDVNWGIGIDIGDKRVLCPAQWRGTNILGWALMESRKALQEAARLPAEDATMTVVPASAGEGEAAVASEKRGEELPELGSSLEEPKKRRWQK